MLKTILFFLCFLVLGGPRVQDEVVEVTKGQLTCMYIIVNILFYLPITR